MPADCPDYSNAMLAGVTMRVFGENRQDLADGNSRTLSAIK
jgi:hypothetical protein